MVISFPIKEMGGDHPHIPSKDMRDDHPLTLKEMGGDYPHIPFKDMRVMIFYMFL